MKKLLVLVAFVALGLIGTVSAVSFYVDSALDISGQDITCPTGKNFICGTNGCQCF